VYFVTLDLVWGSLKCSPLPDMDYISISSFLRKVKKKKKKAKKPLALVKICNFQIHHFTEEETLNPEPLRIFSSVGFFFSMMNAIRKSNTFH